MSATTFPERVLLAHVNGEMPEKPSLKSSSLPELLSAVLKHPDLDERTQMQIWASVIDRDLTDIDSHEFIALALGLKVATAKGEKPQFHRSELRISFAKKFSEAKTELDLIINSFLDHDKEYLHPLILLFGIIKAESMIDMQDLCANLQDYVFAFTKDFDKAADDYIQKVMAGEIKDDSEDSEETDESEQETQAATS